MAGHRRFGPLDLEEEKSVRLVLSLPENLYVSLYHYCLWRNADADKIQVAATKALQAFLASDKAFARWRATQPNLPARAPSNAGRKNEPEVRATTTKPAPPARS
jgi:hypothetical protein